LKAQHRWEYHGSQRFITFQEASMAEIGKTAPDFKLKAHDGSEISLAQYRGSKWVVVSSYPFAFTGG
jgi:hypothetical protein